MASNEGRKSLNSATNAVIKSANELLGDFSTSSSKLNEGLKDSTSDTTKNTRSTSSKADSTSNLVPSNLSIAKSSLITSASPLLHKLSSTWAVLTDEVASTSAGVTKDAAEAVKSLAQGVMRQISTPWMDEAFSQVSVIYDQLKVKSDQNPMKCPMLLALLQKLKEIERQRSKSKKNLNQIGFLDTDMEKINYFGIIALNMQPIVNCDEQTIAAILNIKSDDILKAWFNDDLADVHCPKFLLYSDHVTKSIVLAIRGTYSIRDAVMDIVSDAVPFLNGWAHRGILDGAMKILQEAEIVIKEALLRNSNYSIVITGHSLGGGAAQLIALEMMYGFWKERIGIPPKSDIACYAFGAPPVFASTGSVVPEEVPQIHLLVNKSDVVPTLSLASVGRVLAEISALDSIQLTFYEKAEILLQSSSAVSKSSLTDIVGGISKSYEKLWLYSGETKASLIAMCQSMLKNIMSLSEKEANTVQNEKKKQILNKNKIEMSAMARDKYQKGVDCKEYVTKRHMKEKNKVSLRSTVVPKITNYHADATKQEKAEEKEQVEKDKSTRCMVDNTEKALKIINSVKDDQSAIFLNHPGIVYHVYGLKSSKGNKCGVKRLTSNQKTQLSKNVHLDITHMITDHIPLEYCKVLSNMSQNAFSLS